MSQPAWNVDQDRPAVRKGSSARSAALNLTKRSMFVAGSALQSTSEPGREELLSYPESCYSYVAVETCPRKQCVLLILKNQPLFRFLWKRQNTSGLRWAKCFSGHCIGGVVLPVKGKKTTSIGIRFNKLTFQFFVLFCYFLFCSLRDVPNR